MSRDVQEEMVQSLLHISRSLDRLNSKLEWITEAWLAWVEAEPEEWETSEGVKIRPTRSRSEWMDKS